VQMVQPDAHSTAAFGADVLDPAIREPSARAGLAQGRAEVDRIRPLLAG
jgi:NTE family protein